MDGDCCSDDLVAQVPSHARILRVISATAAEKSHCKPISGILSFHDDLQKSKSLTAKIATYTKKRNLNRGFFPFKSQLRFFFAYFAIFAVKCF